MKNFFKRYVLRPISYVFTDVLGEGINRLLSRKLKKQLLGEITDDFLELLLKGMDLTFYLSKGFRKNIKNFNGRYLFETADNTVEAAAIFKDGDMKVKNEKIEAWNIKITFKDAEALMAYLFSKDQDILNSLLKNEVAVAGNLNYVFRFGFLARDLSHRLGVN